MLIVVQDTSLEAEVVRACASLPALSRRVTRVVVLVGELLPYVARLRELDPDVPMGFIARDEPSAIEAIDAGADEASVIDPQNAASLVTFVDRTMLRARQRGETQRLHTAFAHAEKLAALGTLVAGVGHEINNPLSAVLLSTAATQRYVLPVLDVATELVERARNGQPIEPELLAKISGLSLERVRRDVSSMLDDVTAAASSIASIVRDLRVFARSDQQETPELVDVPELVDHVLRLLGRDVSNHGVITRDYAPQLPPLVIPRGRVTQVLTNLLINAAHAIADVERPVHQVQISVRTDDEFLAVAIRDTGPGIAPEAIERIFDPFYTTKRKELGTGLGLSISRNIMRSLGGDLTVESVFGEGATFLCFLPLPSAEAVREARASVVPAIAIADGAKNQNVLVVDDDPRMLRAYARLLNTEHRVMVAHDATEAIELLESGSAPSIVVLEIDLPGREGERLLSWIATQRPQLSERTVIATAADAQIRHAQALNDHRGPILHKPVRGEALLSVIAELGAPPK